jgi:hypothetical protein
MNSVRQTVMNLGRPHSVVYLGRPHSVVYLGLYSVVYLERRRGYPMYGLWEMSTVSNLEKQMVPWWGVGSSVPFLPT